MKEFWEEYKPIIWLILFFIGLMFLMAFLSANDDARCKEKFGPEWSGNSYGARYGAPQCINDKGEGKYL